MNKTVIRPARDDELPVVAELRWLWLLEREGTPVTAHDEFVHLLTTWARKHAAAHQCLVPVRENTIIGMAWLVIIARVPSPRDRSTTSRGTCSASTSPNTATAGPGHSSCRRSKISDASACSNASRCTPANGRSRPTPAMDSPPTRACSTPGSTGPTDTTRHEKTAPTSAGAVANTVARGGFEPPTFRFSGGRSYQLSYLAEPRSKPLLLLVTAQSDRAVNRRSPPRGRPGVAPGQTSSNRSKANALHEHTPPIRFEATLTGLEPATFAVTGRRANQLRHRARIFNSAYCLYTAYSQRDSNPCCRRERAES